MFARFKKTGMLRLAERHFSVASATRVVTVCSHLGLSLRLMFSVHLEAVALKASGERLKLNPYIKSSHSQDTLQKSAYVF